MPLFNSERKRKEKDLEREVRFKQGISRVHRYVEKCEASRQHVWSQAKRAAQLGDRAMLRNTLISYLRLGDLVTRWERYILAAEHAALMRDHIKATGEFMGSLQAVSDAMMAGMNPNDMIKVQADLERGMARAQNLDEALGVVMDAASTTIFSSEGLSDEQLGSLEKQVMGEASQDESSHLDSRIDEAMKRIEAEMKKEKG
ncbi:MAG: hypothetical protein V1724_08860 [Chloroflexota bacterium]